MYRTILFISTLAFLLIFVFQASPRFHAEDTPPLPVESVDILTVNEFHRRLSAICISPECEIVYRGGVGATIRGKGIQAEHSKESALIWEFRYFSSPKTPNTYEQLFLLRLSTMKTKQTAVSLKIESKTLYVELVSHPDAKLGIDDIVPFASGDPKQPNLTVKQLLSKLAAAR